MKTETIHNVYIKGYKQKTERNSMTKGVRCKI